MNRKKEGEGVKSKPEEAKDRFRASVRTESRGKHSWQNQEEETVSVFGRRGRKAPSDLDNRKPRRNTHEIRSKKKNSQSRKRRKG
jgi:hypothetical protein